jgi:hypothetical protein
LEIGAWLIIRVHRSILNGSSRFLSSIVLIAVVVVVVDLALHSPRRNDYTIAMLSAWSVLAFALVASAAPNNYGQKLQKNVIRAAAPSQYGNYGQKLEMTTVSDVVAPGECYLSICLRACLSD